MDYSFDEDIFDKVWDKIKLLFVPIKENKYSPIILDSRGLFYAVILVLVIKILIVSISLNFPKYIFFSDVSKTDLTQLINKERTALGLKALGQNTKLDEAALLKAKDMAYNQYFAHTSPAGVNPWFWFKKIGYNYKYAGENLAIGFTESEDVYNAWFESDSHRENFLNQNYNEMGTAVLNSNFGGNNTIIVVQLFGKQKTQITPKSIIQDQKPVAISTKGGNMAIKADNGRTIEVIDKKVLSATMNLPDDVLAFRQDDGKDKGAYNLKFLNAIFYRYDEFFGKFVFWMFVFVSIISIMNILVNYPAEAGSRSLRDKMQNRKLVLRSFLMVCLLCFGVFIDKESIIHIFSLL